MCVHAHCGPAWAHFVCWRPVRADGRNVAFGTVVSGLDVVTAIAGQFHVDGKPLQDVVIRDCGLL
jgi:cyclophilin family peptidyl-prolyl cis-trans isomerase